MGKKGKKETVADSSTLPIWYRMSGNRPPLSPEFMSVSGVADPEDPAGTPAYLAMSGNVPVKSREIFAKLHAETGALLCRFPSDAGGPPWQDRGASACWHRCRRKG